MKISKNKIATFHYRLTSEDGTLIEDSFESEPLIYLHGQGNLIVGMEKALEGKKAGDQFTVEIKAEEGYGERFDGLVQTVPRNSFDGIKDIEVGMRFRASTEHGEVPVVVTAVTENDVVVDGNHPLAGITLNFTVEVKDVRDATTEEIEHGHVHGAGGHHH